MAGDFSRSTVNPIQHYTGVLMQQGRVQVDADWNEQLALQLHRTWTETRDLIGRCGTPKAGSGFAISSFANSSDLRIHPGRYYVNGLMCELEPEVIPAWLPQTTSPPSGVNTVFHMSAGQPFSSVLRKIEISRAPNAAPKFMTALAENVISIPSLAIDGRDLAVGDWVEIFAGGGSSVIAMVTKTGAATAPSDPNVIVPSYYPITVDRSLSSLSNDGPISLRRVVTFTSQPFHTNQWDASVETSPLSGPAAAALHLPDGDYLVVLEAWLREVNALEDPHIREVALGGPDTCERLQTVWQVHVLPWSGESSPPGSPLSSPLPSPPSPPNCCSDFPSFDAYKAANRTTGLLNAQAPPPGNNVPQCQLPPSAGYLGLANQLYRVEIFQSGEFNQTASMVWSRDNAMVELPIVCLDADGNVYVSTLGTDDLHSFDVNDWVEIVDDDAELGGEPRFLAIIAEPPGAAAQAPCASAGVQAYCLNLQPSAPARFQNRTNLRLRRWDMPQTAVAIDSSGNAIGIPIVPGWIPLENNIQVNFSDGFYATRSFWQIPARTATGDIEWPPFQVPNTNPIPRPPLGPDHFFCRLALLTVTDGEIQIEHSRRTFSSLTSLCADDICCTLSGCELSPVGTVQQAIEELEARQRLHNRTLHGSGVVCGLAVTCPKGNMPPTSLGVAPGYGIDEQGYDLILSTATTVDLTSLITLSPTETAIPNGEYELILERASHPSSPLGKSSDSCCAKTVPATNPGDTCVQFRAIPCEEETLSNQVLDGSLLQDFYTHCLEPSVNAFKTEYLGQYISPDHQVTEAQALLSALTNLLVQYTQPTLTKDVYISASEAQLLGTFYTFLLNQISDCTYCSLLSGMRPFPAYPLSAPIETVYGKGYKTRFRVDPTGARAFAFGSGPDLLIYDLVSGQLASSVTPPIPGDASGWTLQDVAFSQDGSQLYAIATGVNTVTNAKDSLFAVGRLAGTAVTWTLNGSAGPQSYLTLASFPQVQEVIYASAQGAGIYQIVFAQGVKATQLAQFNAIGHLLYSGNNLYATAIVPNADGGNTYEVQRYEAAAAKAGEPASMVFPLQGMTLDLTDDIAVGLFLNAPNSRIEIAVFATGLSPASATKHLVLFNGSDKGEQVGQIDLGQNTTVRLALHPGGASLLVSYESISGLSTIAGGANGLSLATYAPVELHPTGVAFGEHSGSTTALYTLNSTANTISQMPASMAAFADYKDLEEYRVQALNAYIDAIGAYLQYLKDCFCKLLLPGCSTLNSDKIENAGVGLACITIQDGVVERICNLEKRKIVKSFPTVGYWLSLIPIIPLAKALVERFCCLTLPSIFGKMAVADPTKQNVPSAPTNLTASLTSLSGENLRYTLSQTQKINFSSLPSMLLEKSAPLGKLSLDAVLNPFRQPPPALSAVSIANVNGMSLDQAKSTLQTANVQVAATQVYDPTTLAQNVSSYLTAPASVPPGSSVTLVVDSNNTVRYYVPTAPAVQQLSTNVATEINTANQATQQLETRVGAVETAESPAIQNVQSLQNLVNGLQTQITNMQTAQASALAQRDQKIAELTATTQQLQAKVSAVDTLSTQVQAIEGRLPPAAKS